MRKLTCHCEQVFNVDLPETVNVDESPDVIARIADGSFLSCVCPACNSVLQTDVRTRIEWPSKSRTIELIPEVDRLSYLSGAIKVDGVTDVVIGYPELSDRIAALQAGLEPAAMEALKYHLSVKAKESSADANVEIVFEKITDSGNLEFHVHGLRKGEVAVTSVPRRVYDAIVAELTGGESPELYETIKNGPYVSVKNILIEGNE